MSKLRIIAVGRARCVLTPFGQSGFKGYTPGTVYSFERIKADKTGREYVRVYPSEEPYRETCGVGTFDRFFEVVLESVPPAPTQPET